MVPDHEAGSAHAATFGPDEWRGGCAVGGNRQREEPISLPNRETRTLLEDGDAGLMRARGFVRIGLGEVIGQVMTPRVHRTLINRSADA